MSRKDRRQQQAPQQQEKNTVAKSILGALGLDVIFAGVFSSFKDAVVAPIMKEIAKHALNSEHRDIFCDIVYFRLTTEETKKLRGRLNKAKKDYTEDKTVALLARMFRVYPSTEERVDYIRKLEKMDDTVFKEFLYSAEHDPIEQLIFRLGKIVKETAEKTAQNISAAGEKAFDYLGKGARWTDAKATSAAPRVGLFARWLSERRGGSQWNNPGNQNPSEGRRMQ